MHSSPIHGVKHAHIFYCHKIQIIIKEIDCTGCPAVLDSLNDIYKKADLPVGTSYKCDYCGEDLGDAGKALYNKDI